MKTLFAAALVAFGSSTYAQVSKKCQGSVCFSLNIPASTSSSGTIYMQLSAPTSMQWVSLGQGTSMSGSNMFVMYTDSAGSNVTLSPRLGTGHSEPQYNSDAKITLLAGTGVSGGQMVANIRCESCTSWSGGSADFSSSAGDWIYATKSGNSLNSDSTSASISQHDSRGSLSFDYSAAKGGSSANPLVSSSSSGSGSSGSACGQSSASSSATPTSGSSSSTATGNLPPWASFLGGSSNLFKNYGRAVAIDACTSDNSTTTTTGSFSDDSTLSASRATMMLVAHGVLACLAFAIFFPISGIIIRVLSFSGLVWLHASIQVVAYILFIASFGLGIYVAKSQQLLHEYHPVIGILLFVAVFFQPILGMMHHRLYNKYQTRTLTSYVHIWLGRIIITLGIINGGLGFLLANNTTYGPIVYGFIAGVVWLAYVAAAVRGESMRKRRQRGQPPKYTEPPTTSEHAPRAPHQPEITAVPPPPPQPPRGADGRPMEYYGQGQRKPSSTSRL